MTAKLIKKSIGILFLLPCFYLLMSFFGSVISVNELTSPEESIGEIYLNTNGIHLDIIFPKELLPSLLLSDLEIDEGFNYVAFGWGDKNFYLNTPRWEDFKIKYAIQAFFLTSETLMHVSKYQNQQKKWVAVKVDQDQLEKLNVQILSSFHLLDSGKKIILEGKGYHQNDAFFKAEGSYSCLKTCNTWANACFKTSGIKACFWTPFDFALLRLHK